MRSCFSISKSRLAEDVILEESGGSRDDPTRILIVMDALKEFSFELLEWVLNNFTFRHCCTITLLGIMPWLNIPLSAKTRSDIWSMDFDDLSSFQEKNEFKNDPKYQKIQRLIQLCRKYGVVPDIVTEMGHPIRLLVVEQISSLHATLVVFDRHHDKKHIEYYAEKITCDMVVMNDNGDVDLIKKRKLDTNNNHTPLPPLAEEAEEEKEEDYSSTLPPSCSKSIISEHIKKYLKSKTRGNNKPT
ncbi:hypothetical protein ABFX02_01G111700 [Erythranthe guttata]